MPFKKNTAVTGFSFGLVSASDGSAITSGTVNGYYLLNGGTQGSITGTPVHEGNGQWSVDLLAAEMNGDVVGLLFTHASAINAHFTIKTETKLVSELNDLTTAQVNAECDTALTDYDAVVPADLPTNFGDLAITVTTGRVDVASIEGVDATNQIRDAVVDDATRIDASALNTLSSHDPGSQIAAQTDVTGLNDPTAAAIADAVWDEASTGHVDAGKAGQQLWTDIDAVLADTDELQTDDVPGLIGALNDPTAAAVADAVWDELATGHTDAGKAGEQLWTDVDAVLADTNELQTDDVPGLIAALNDPTAAAIRTEMDANSTQLAAIVGDTNELQGDWTNGGRLDLIIDELTTQGDTNETAIGALNDLSAAQVNAEMVDVVGTDVIPDSIAADGSRPTMRQALLMLTRFLMEKDVSSTTMTVYKEDGTTGVMTFTLNDDTNPSAITRAT